jgi:UrcA family protein
MVRLAIVALALAVAATPATAAVSRQTLLAVRLEMKRDAGDAALLRRLNMTARALCSRTASPLFPGNEGRAWKCRRNAVAAALGRRGQDVDV